MNNLFRIFTAIVVVSIILLAIIYYNNSKYTGDTLPLDIQTKLKQKEYHIRQLIVQKYNRNINVPIIISNKIADNLFGLATYDKDGIKIILNKNRFQESSEYMIDYVLPHEYAHALMFVFRDFTKENGGHTLKWQKICLDLEGKKCDRFVQHNDIILGKLDFLY